MKKFKVTMIETNRWEYVVEGYDADDAMRNFDEGMHDWEGEMVHSRQSKAVSAEYIGDNKCEICGYEDDEDCRVNKCGGKCERMIC